MCRKSLWIQSEYGISSVNKIFLSVMSGYTELYQLACCNLSSVFIYTQHYWLWLLVQSVVFPQYCWNNSQKVSHDVFQVKIQKRCFILLLVLSFAFNTVSIVLLKCHIHSLGLYDSAVWISTSLIALLSEDFFFSLWLVFLSNTTLPSPSDDKS